MKISFKCDYIAKPQINSFELHIQSTTKPYINPLPVTTPVCMFVIAIEMRELFITVIVMVLMDSTESQYPNCVDSCPAGK